MTIRLRKLPRVVIPIVFIGVFLLWLAFCAGPVYNLLTNRIVEGRVVHADTSSSTVLVGNTIYPFSNNCIDIYGFSSCHLKEGATGFFLVNSPQKVGYRLDQMLLSIAISVIGTLVIVGFITETRFIKPKPPVRHHHHR